MMAKKTTAVPARRTVTISLTISDHERLDALCKARAQSKADFLRGAMAVAERVPIIKTKPLSGSALDRHKAKVARERREARRQQRKRK